MPNKTKIISIIAIIVGVGLIPTGIGISAAINDEMAQGVPDALLGIQEEILPEINDTLKTMGIPDVLSGIYVEGFPLIHFLVNCTFVAGGLSEFYNMFAPALTGIDLILNNPVISSLLEFLGFPPIKGVSEYITNATMSLNYTATAQEKLTFGNETIGLPGLMEDIDVGWGVLDYLNLYEEASNDSIKKDFMITNYNATWGQLTNLTNYITDYYMVEAINLILQSSMCPPEYVGLTTVDITDLMYYDQWANASMGQLDLGDLLGLPYSVIGFEAGFPDATNISLATTLELFNPTNEYAFMNITYSGDLPSLQETDGLAKWLVANASDDLANTTKVALKTVFNLEDFQFDAIINWLWGYDHSFKEDVVPGLFLYDMGMTVTSYSEILFYAQWTNGTLYPNGLVLPIGNGISGWEVGVPTPSEIQLVSAELLFDVSNNYALVNPSGIQSWYSLLNNPNQPVFVQAMTTLDLSYSQMNAIVKWLPKFRDEIVPILAQYEMNLPFNPSILSAGLLYGMTIPGGILAALGVTMIILRKRKVEG
ncbi:MAG: hypothetical protein HWN80_14655 [Candidatus Lokiarchaeota archaeon]|nr:hypothetical protein [Candidatus Lokiarchaeota archaeon]